MLSIEASYFLFVFASIIGMLQWVAARQALLGLSLFRGHRQMGYAFGLLTTAGAFCWFFTSDNRNARGVEGSEQTLCFALALGGALLLTLFLSSLVNGRRGPASPPPPGLEALKQYTYLDILPAWFRIEEKARHDGA